MELPILFIIRWKIKEWNLMVALTTKLVDRTGILLDKPNKSTSLVPRTQSKLTQGYPSRIPTILHSFITSMKTFTTKLIKMLELAEVLSIRMSTRVGRISPTNSGYLPTMVSHLLRDQLVEVNTPMLVLHLVWQISQTKAEEPLSEVDSTSKLCSVDNKIPAKLSYPIWLIILWRHTMRKFMRKKIRIRKIAKRCQIKPSQR